MTEIPIGIVAILALVGAHIIWVLLPLAPAVLIYWLFPNTLWRSVGRCQASRCGPAEPSVRIWWCCC